VVRVLGVLEATVKYARTLSMLVLQLAWMAVILSVFMYFAPPWVEIIAAIVMVLLIAWFDTKYNTKKRSR